MNDEEFWSSRKILSDIRLAARARRAGPYGVLGVTLINALATVPPRVRLEPVVGGPGSLNLNLALVGPSGRGKGAAEAVARFAVQWLHDDGDSAVPTGVPLGSGEGIARTFHPVGAEEQTSEAAIFVSHEVDSLTALTGRNGSTLAAELRKMFSGEPLGFANAGAATRCLVDAHTYRACVILGVQPSRSGPLLAAADGGLPQRFIWLPVDDPDAPDLAPNAPRVRELVPQTWGSSTWVELELPAEAKQSIDAHRVRALRGDPEIDPLDGHVLFVQEKIAAALMILDGRKGINDDDWQLAGFLMEVSADQRESCLSALREQSRRRIYAKASDTADQAEIVSEKLAKRTRAHILRKLTRHGQLTRGQLYRTAKAPLRPYCDPALSDMVDAGEVLVFAGRNGSDTYALCTGGTQGTHRENTSPSAETDVYRKEHVYQPLSRNGSAAPSAEPLSSKSMTVCALCQKRTPGPTGMCDLCSAQAGFPATSQTQF